MIDIVELAAQWMKLGANMERERGGHVLTTIDAWGKRAVVDFDKIVADAVAAERERCAKICDDHAASTISMETVATAKKLAAAIRERHYD